MRLMYLLKRLWWLPLIPLAPLTVFGIGCVYYFVIYHPLLYDAGAKYPDNFPPVFFSVLSTVITCVLLGFVGIPYALDTWDAYRPPRSAKPAPKSDPKPGEWR